MLDEDSQVSLENEGIIINGAGGGIEIEKVEEKER